MNANTAKPVPTIADVQAAARRLRGVAVVTPLLAERTLTERLGRPVFVKAEVLQTTGSFKFRGAYNRISAMSAEERARGVVAFSSGNHAQGVAAAAQLWKTRATIVMPSDAPQVKIEGTRSWGAEIVLYDRERESREAIAARLAEQRGSVLIPSFDDPHVIAGQGTVGLEIAEAVAARGLALSAAVTPVGGGGLASGIGIALAEAAPEAVLVGVEPAGFDDAARSLAAGSIQKNPKAGGSAQDALLTPEICELTFTLLKRHARHIGSVSDEAAFEAVAHAARHLKLKVEPGGAAALAYVLQGYVPPGEAAIVIVLSGGNAD